MEKRHVTVRPPLSREDDAKIDYIAKLEDVPKERAVAAILRRGIDLHATGDELLQRILKEESVEYRTNRSNAQKNARKNGKRKKGGIR